MRVFIAGRPDFPKGVNMRSVFKKFGIAALCTVSVIGATLASTNSAEARWGGHHHGGWGWGGPALIGGLVLGTALAARPAYGYYGGDCFLRRRVVGYTYSGRPIVRHVRVCY